MDTEKTEVAEAPQQDAVMEAEKKPENPVAAEETTAVMDAEGPAEKSAEQQPAPENNPEAAVLTAPAEGDPEPAPESAPEAEVPQQQAADAEPSSQETVERVEKVPEPEADVASREEAVVEKEAVPVETVVAEEVQSVEAAMEAESATEKPKDVSPAAGSLAFALLERDQTKEALKASRTLIVIRGLPGSGKSFLACAIADAYKDHCCVISADDHGVIPETPESSADGYKALDDAVVTRCGEVASPVLIVVDDTNHTHDRLARLGELAEQHRLVPVFLEPQTDWGRDLAQLTQKTRRGLQEAQLTTMRVSLEEVSLPLYFGWFLLPAVEEKLRCTAMDFLKTLDTLEAFKKHSSDFTGKAEKEVDLEQHFKATGLLHCTTKFCNYGKAEGAKEYAEKPAVKTFYGAIFELSLTALFVTPRTVGAQVSLSEEQLSVWPADEKRAESSAAATPSLPLGSRAHITLGCAEGVEPVQTGLDLLDILALQEGGQQREAAEEMALGSLSYYSEGRWLLALREPVGTAAIFSSFYGRKEPEVPSKKGPEKKKKPKCTLL
ncbi:2',3'-cyclic-nucleotide 3'-phosphodiesterase [Pholidichthys leucotaenia]